MCRSVLWVCLKRGCIFWTREPHSANIDYPAFELCDIGRELQFDSQDYHLCPNYKEMNAALYYEANECPDCRKYDEDLEPTAGTAKKS